MRTMVMMMAAIVYHIQVVSVLLYQCRRYYIEWRFESVQWLIPLRLVVVHSFPMVHQHFLRLSQRQVHDDLFHYGERMKRRRRRRGRRAMIPFDHYRNDILPRHETSSSSSSSSVLRMITSIPDITPHTTSIDTMEVAATSLTLGNITQLLLQNHLSTTTSSTTISFVEAMRIPTFLCSGGGGDDGDDGWFDRQSSSDTNHHHHHHHHRNHQQQESSSLVSPLKPSPTNTVAQNISWYIRNDDDNHEHHLNPTIQYGPAFTISNVLSPLECQDIIKACEMAMYHHTLTKPKITTSTTSPLQQHQQLAFNKSVQSDGMDVTMSTKPKLASDQNITNIYPTNNSNNNHNNNNNNNSTIIRTPPPPISSRNRKNQHGAMQLIVSQSIVDIIAQRIASFIPIHMVQDRKQELDQYHHHHHYHYTNNYNTNTTSNLSPPSQLMFVGLNRRFRIYKYTPNHMDHFKPHIDAGFPPSGIVYHNNNTTNHSNNNITTTTNNHHTPTNYDTRYISSTSNTPVLQFDNTQQYIETLQSEYPFRNNYTIVDIVSRLTILFYLNDNFTGGTTNFYEPIVKQNPQQQQSSVNDTTDTSSDHPIPKMIASVQPKTGMVLIFPQCVGADVMDQYAKIHWPTHEGSPVHIGSPTSKYVIRSDLLFAEVISKKKSETFKVVPVVRLEEEEKTTIHCLNISKNVQRIPQQ